MNNLINKETMLKYKEKRLKCDNKKNLLSKFKSVLFHICMKKS